MKNSVRVLSQAALLLILSFVVIGCSAVSGGVVPRPAPYARFIMLDGETVTLSQLKGKKVVVVFWATTCSRSGRVLQALEEIAQKHAKDNSIAFVAVSVDKLEKMEKVTEVIQARKIDTLRVAFSGNDVYDESYMAFGVDHLPSVYVIDPSGQVIAEGSDETPVLDTLK